MTNDRNVLYTMDGYRIVGIAPMPDWHSLAYSAYAVIGPDGAELVRDATFEEARLRLEEIARLHRKPRVAARER